MSRQLSVIVEVQCDAPRRDWPELANLLRLYLRRTAVAAQEQKQRFPFPAGKRVDWPAFATAVAACHTDSAATAAMSSSPFSSGSIFPPAPPAVLRNGIQSLRVCDLTDPALLSRTIPNASTTATSSSKQSARGDVGIADVTFLPLFYLLHADAVLEDGVGEDEGGLPACTQLCLPHRSLEGMWESLSYGESLEASIAMKKDLLEYVHTALLFSLVGVDVHQISWNRMVLLHGPPGTGKTSLCKALSHKLAVRLCSAGELPTNGNVHHDPFPSFAPLSLPAFSHHNHNGGSLFSHARLVEINAHSLFSRWFSESGKQVMQLFVRIRAVAADPTCLVVVLIDEVESLAAARQSAMKGNEPSDSIRVVNALLTQLDSLQHHRNVLVLATSNLTGAIDVAFLDRADKKVYVGPPGREARRAMLHASLMELLDKGLIHFADSTTAVKEPSSDAEKEANYLDASAPDPVTAALESLEAIVLDSAGFNGRLLKKLPFLAYGACMSSQPGAWLPTAAAAAVSPAASAGNIRSNGGGGTHTRASLKPTFAGGDGPAPGEEEESKAESEESNHEEERGEPVCSSPMQSFSAHIYLYHLHAAVRHERATRAQMATTDEHLSSN